MSILTQASNKSLWRGLEYYEQGKVTRAEIADENTVTGEVSGSDGTLYHITLNLAKPQNFPLATVPSPAAVRSSANTRSPSISLHFLTKLRPSSPKTATSKTKWPAAKKNAAPTSAALPAVSPSAK